MPAIRRVLETALYCHDLPVTAGFYARLLNIEPMLRSERLVALTAGEGSVLLLFLGLSGPSHKYAGIRPPMHPGWLRCSSLRYSRYPHSSRLASRAGPPARQPRWGP